MWSLPTILHTLYLDYHTVGTNPAVGMCIRTEEKTCQWLHGTCIVKMSHHSALVRLSGLVEVIG